MTINLDLDPERESSSGEHGVSDTGKSQLFSHELIFIMNLYFL